MKRAGFVLFGILVASNAQAAGAKHSAGSVATAKSARGELTAAAKSARALLTMQLTAERAQLGKGKLFKEQRLVLTNEGKLIRKNISTAEKAARLAILTDEDNNAFPPGILSTAGGITVSIDAGGNVTLTNK